ncbi:auxin response factor 5 isoform X1 [Prunus yedoensis var. nudiflora]|uniref:Auxin response factor 5 isoform X1 n=1 Tax=Prunus yedoensis var. nudiflora TaxID=2094558 RepID=A0A314XT07_PRUYE|nr:auxin response factor 5 isoform X1 [Prunus yedoensis var. nudiflora]
MAWFKVAESSGVLSYSELLPSDLAFMFPNQYYNSICFECSTVDSSTFTSLTGRVGGKQNRVSSWEIETPENLFIFPSLTSSLKRPLHSGFLGAETEWGNLIKRPFIWVPEIGNGNSFPYSISNLCLEQLVNMLLKPQLVKHAGTLAALQQQSSANRDLIADMKTMQVEKRIQVSFQKVYLPNQNPPQSSMDQSAAINVNTSRAILPGKLNNLTKFRSQTPVGNSTHKTKLDPDFSADQLGQLNSTGQGIEDKLAAGFVSPYNHVYQLTFANQNQSAAQLQTTAYAATFGIITLPLPTK